MRKALRILVGMILSISPVLSQTTTVTGTVKDTANQGWINAKLTFNLYNPSHVQRPIYCKTNLPVTVIQIAIAGTDANASYSISLPQNSTICPANTRWQLTVCPIATSGCFTDAPINATGASLTYNVTPDPPSFSGPNTYGYRTDEVLNPLIGDLFWNVYSNLCSQYNGGTLISPAWQDCRVNTNSNAFIKPGPFDNIQYVSNNGNDTNDGLSWGSAKLTVAAACAALPGGNNTCTSGNGLVYVSPSFSGTVLVPEIIYNQTTTPGVRVIYLPSTGRTITLGSSAFPMNYTGLQAAITDLCGAGAAGAGPPGGSVLLPVGAVYVTTTISIINCPVKIFGSAGFSQIYNSISGGGAAFLIANSPSGVQFSGIDFVETTTANSPMIDFDSYAGSNALATISDDTFSGGTDAAAAEMGIELRGSVALNFALIDGIFSNLHFTGNQQAIFTSGTAQVPAGEGNLWSNIDVQVNSVSPQTVSAIAVNDNSEIWTNVRVENQLAAGVPAFTATGVLNSVNIVCDTNQHCISDAGGSNKWNVTFISGDAGIKAASSSMWVGDVTKSTTYFVPATGTVASFPACSTSLRGTQIFVTDSTTQTWGAALAGSGTFPAQAVCDGTGYTVIGK